MEYGFENETNLSRVERALKESARVPYNNATVVYERSGLNPDPRMGGSCLYKLRVLSRLLPDGAQQKVIASTAGKTTHYALVAQVDGKEYYLDPFLWQSELLNLEEPAGSEVDTLYNKWKIKIEESSDDSSLRISLIDTVSGNAMATHNFTDELSYIPKPSTLLVNQSLPSFMMQFVSKDGNGFYKVWYSKVEEKLADIWATDPITGERKKVTRDGLNSDIRANVVADIEKMLTATEQEIVSYFAKAHELEKKLDTIPLGEVEKQHDH